MLICVHLLDEMIQHREQIMQQRNEITRLRDETMQHREQSKQQRNEIARLRDEVLRLRHTMPPSQ